MDNSNRKLFYLNFKAKLLLSRGSSKVQWSSDFEAKDVCRKERESLLEARHYSLYLHIPFCERFCTFCGCNTSITGDHSWEETYYNLLDTEKRKRFGDDFQFSADRMVVGGGTPSFFSANNMRKLLRLFYNEDKPPGQVSFEIDPRVTSEDQLKMLVDHNVNHFLISVVDINSRVQNFVSRKLERDHLESLWTFLEGHQRKPRFEFLLGLPGQDMESQKENFQVVKSFSPTEVQLNRFIKVPWIKDHQKSYSEKDIPADDLVNQFEEYWTKQLAAEGYHPLGFGLWVKKEAQNSALNISLNSKTLSRDISGFSSFDSDCLVGFGVGAQSSGLIQHIQNYKALPVYQRELQRGHFPFEAIHNVGDQDDQFSQVIKKVLNSPQSELEDMAENLMLKLEKTISIRHFAPLIIARELNLISEQEVCV